MKKLKFLISLFLISLMLIGTGYAAWSDTLITNNTVETGEFALEFVGTNDKSIGVSSADSEKPVIEAVSASLGQLRFPDTKGSDKYVETSIETIEGKTNSIQVTFNNLYPGAWAGFRLKAINSGTIPAKIENIDVEFSGDSDELLDYLKYESGLELDANKDNNIDNNGSMYVKGSLENMKYDFNNKLKDSETIKNAQIVPGGSIYFDTPDSNATDLDGDGSKERFIIIKFDESAPNETQGKTLTFTLTVNFKQFNIE
jgi:hypothetical protein